MRAARRHLGLTWPGVGLLGSVLISTSGTALLARRPVHWWWRVPLLSGHWAEWHVFWLGVILLCVAWLGLGRELGVRGSRPAVRPRDLVLVGALWSLPLALGPALFSLDMYSYLAQGSLLAHGLNPYQVAPNALAHWHETGLLSAVSTNWRHTTAPYGPVFLAIAGAIAGVAGSHVTLGVTLLRLPELAGLGLLAAFVPRLARVLGADPVRATWLAVISPLSLLYLIGGGHNDALMTGLMLAGVTLALERRPLAGIVLCTLAATVKLPALAAVAVIGVCWLRAEPARWRQVIATSAAAVSAVVVGAGLLTGVGLTWISGSLFSTPASVRLALTPATAVAVTLYEALHHGGPGVAAAAHSFEHTATIIGFGVTALVALGLLWRVRYRTLARYLGVMLLVAALGGPAAWPWYLAWGLALLAADPVAQRSRWFVSALVVTPFVVMAGGQVAVALPHAPRVFVAYVILAALAGALALRRRRVLRTPAPSAAPVPVPVPAIAIPPVAHVQRHESHAVARADAAG